MEEGLGYATNPGNLRLELADFAGVPTPEATPAADATPKDDLLETTSV
jgi:hypothetical protein